ncbi:MAG: hypothetical protein J6C28_05410 [Bacilli bacterium]|nr:hypothetical protein [Bacilli bacterium]
MRKPEYFKKEELEKHKLSEYLEYQDSDFKYLLCDKGKRIPRTKYIIEVLGDVEMDKETYKLFIGQFQSFGGRYDVRTKPETIKGIYEISKKYPFLSTDALEEIWFVYIRDQFEEYALDEMLEKYFELHGRTDDAFGAYLDFVDRKAKEYDARFEEDAETLDKYISEYGLDFIKHLKYIVKSQHIPASDIEKSLPEKELVDKDRQQLIDISTQTRIFMGACHPISYQMIESLATKEGLDYYPDQPAYLINGTRTIATTFTKQEFLDSIQRRLTGGDTPKQLKKQ